MKYFLLFALLLSHSFVFCQDKNKIDSLLVALSKQKEDSLKACIYHTICEEYKSYDLKKVSIYNDKLATLSQKLKYQKGIGLYYYNLSKITFFNNETEKAISNARKAKDIFYKIKDWDNYFPSCCNLADYLIMNEAYKEANSLLYVNLKLAIVRKNDKNLPLFYHQLSRLYSAKSLYKEALIYAKKAIALETDTNKKISIYQNTSHIYSSLGNYKLAEWYMNLAIRISDSPLRKHRLLVQKVDILIIEKKYLEALPICLKNEQFFKQTNDETTHIYNRLFLTKCYYYLKKYDLALLQLNKFLIVPKLKKDLKVKVFVLASNIYLETNKKKEAQQYINKAIDLLNPDDYYELKLNIYTTKYKVEDALGNYKTALIYYQKQAEIKEEENLKINTDKINELQIDFDLTDKNNKIKNLELAQLKKTIENKNQKENVVYLSIALIISLLSAFFYFRNNKIIKKKNFIIENEKQLTQKSLAEKETLLKEIHHRVKNNMQLVISLLKIQSLDAKQLSIEEFINVSEARITSMALIHENLYQNETLDKVCFKDYLNNLTQSIIGSQHSAKEIELQTTVGETFLDIQTAIPIGLIVNELVNNAYKHAFENRPNGKIGITLTQHQEEFTLSISDDGVGFNNNQKKQDGLGLELVRLLVSQIKGVLQIDNTVGTSYTIQFQNAML